MCKGVALDNLHLRQINQTPGRFVPKWARRPTKRGTWEQHLAHFPPPSLFPFETSKWAGSDFQFPAVVRLKDYSRFKKCTRLMAFASGSLKPVSLCGTSNWPGRLMKERHDENPGDRLSGFDHSAPSASNGGVADVDVALNGQTQSQPDWGRVENLGHIFQHGFVGVTRLAIRYWFHVPQCVDVEVPAKENMFLFLFLDKTGEKFKVLRCQATFIACCSCKKL